MLIKRVQLVSAGCLSGVSSNPQIMALVVSSTSKKSFYSLHSTGWFQENMLTWFHNPAKINWFKLTPRA